MSYLTEPMRKVAQHHLKPEETVLTAIYAHHTVLHSDGGWLWLTRHRQIHHPARAFVLTPERALILEDPTDPATSTADSQYLFASCSLNNIMLFELRSHLLDCALTLVQATSSSPERITIVYSGVSELAFLAAVACMRALVDDQPLPSSNRPDEMYTQERATSFPNWHAALVGLELKQKNAITRYLAAGEHIQEWLSVPIIDESTWWQRFGVAAREKPPAVLVSTDRQILLVKEVKRIVRGQTVYGSDAWLMPKKRVQSARVVSGERNELDVQLTLEHMGVTDVVHLPIPPEQTERVLTFVMASSSMHE